MKFGWDVLWYPVGYAAGYLVLLVFIAGPLRRFGAYTIPDFAEGRFDSPRFRRLVVGLVIVIGFFYTLPQMKAAGITLNSSVGVPYPVGVGLVAMVVVSIVVAGGMRGITFVQALQFAMKLFAISLPVFVLLAHIGPPIRIIQTPNEVILLYSNFWRVVPTNGRPHGKRTYECGNELRTETEIRSPFSIHPYAFLSKAFRPAMIFSRVIGCSRMRTPHAL